MNLFRKLAVTTVALGSVGVGAPVHAAGPYSPQQAISVMYDMIRAIVLPGEATNSSKRWLSLTMVGAMVTQDDPLQINDIANSCPDPSPVVQDFVTIRHLDQVYQRLLDGLVGPFRPESPDVATARKVLLSSPTVPTAEYAAYTDYRKQYNGKLSSMFKSTDAFEREQLTRELALLEQDWNILGYRGLIDEALNVVDTAANEMFGPTRMQTRRVTLATLRAAGLSNRTGYFSPLSQLSPTPDKWPTASNWVGFSYASKDTESSYSASSASNRGFGGLNLGFVTLVGQGGGGNSNVNKVSQVFDFSYEFELARVTIRRPWLDAEVLYQPKSWTWKTNPGTTVYPRVAVDPNAAGKPLPSAANVYNNVSVDCSMIPSEFIIARNRKLVATVTKSDYEEINRAGSSGGGGSLFGIFGGGGSRQWSSTIVNQSENNVTFKVDAPGIAVIGFISDVLPQLPAPNIADTWPSNAWLPK